jgi:hypothetical protein
MLRDVAHRCCQPNQLYAHTSNTKLLLRKQRLYKNVYAHVIYSSLIIELISTFARRMRRPTDKRPPDSTPPPHPPHPSPPGLCTFTPSILAGTVIGAALRNHPPVPRRRRRRRKPRHDGPRREEVNHQP